MNFNKEVKKAAIKNQRKRKIQDVYYKSIRFIIGKPYLFIEKKINDHIKKRMLKNETEYRGKVIKELIKYIQHLLTKRSNDSVTISIEDSYYDDWEVDVILDEFIGYGFTPSKYNKVSKKFYIHVLKRKKYLYIYKEILNDVLNHFKKYDDITVKKCEERKKDYWSIKMK